jgi:hypothetical protein
MLIIYNPAHRRCFQDSIMALVTDICLRCRHNKIPLSLHNGSGGLVRLGRMLGGD